MPLAVKFQWQGPHLHLNNLLQKKSCALRLLGKFNKLSVKEVPSVPSFLGVPLTVRGVDTPDLGVTVPLRLDPGVSDTGVVVPGVPRPGLGV